MGPTNIDGFNRLRLEMGFISGLGTYDLRGEGAECMPDESRPRESAEKRVSARFIQTVKKRVGLIYHVYTCTPQNVLTVHCISFSFLMTWFLSNNDASRKAASLGTATKPIRYVLPLAVMH